MLQKLLFASLATVSADIYLHSPRGSNNRLDDENRDRNNGNRLFDSQNNNRGGANVGNMVYYAGSKLRVEWSQQHSCGNPNSHCELIVQYMCDDLIRDGTTTTTIPEDPAQCYNNDCDTDVRYGRHESFDYYKNCVNRERNKGLFTSSQNLKGDSAKYTRQNPNGGRRGYECPEERDYYPYWHPSPWIDLAILTNDVTRCKNYQENSQNVKSLGHCEIQEGSAYDVERYNKMHGHGHGNKKIQIPITREGGGEGKRCEDIDLGKLEGDEHDSYDVTVQARWVESGTSKVSQGINVGEPECLKTDWSRDNHHGNVDGGYFTSYNLTIPDHISEQCVLRIRYNITTHDFPHFDGDDGVTTADLTAANNKAPGGDEKKPAHYDIAALYGLNQTGTDIHGYYLQNNPQVQLFAELEGDQGQGEVKLQLAVNTAQYGRTFQDRTHRFAIRKNPYSGTVHNLEVKGKRGNVVQTYPGTEYEFSPQRLHLKKNSDFVHFQWTGSNTNPNNNAGQGRQGTDRSNIVLLRSKNYDEPSPTDTDGDNGITYGHYGNSYPTKDIEKDTFLGFSADDVQRLAGVLDTAGASWLMSGEMSELDDASTKFNLPPRKCMANGVYHYLSTRNNNFSNRSQKGTIICGDTAVTAYKISPLGMSVASAGYSIDFAGVDTGSEAVISQTDTVDVSGLSDMVGVSQVLSSSIDANNLKLNYGEGSLKSYDAFTRSGTTGTWEEVDGAECDSGVCAIGSASANSQYVVIETTDGGAIAGIIIGSLVLVAVIAFVVVFVMRKMKG